MQRVCPGYRTALFSRLSTDPDWEVTLFIGDDIPDSKVRNAPRLDGIKFQKLRTRFLRLGGRVLPWHLGLVRELRRLRPDVILAEGESHFLGYLQAIWYRFIYNRDVRLIHWCFIALPGEPLLKPGIAGRIKALTRRFFHAHLLYSSFSKQCLAELGINTQKMFVATNVGDVARFVRTADSLPQTRREARSLLDLPERFTVLYVGTLDANKRPSMLLDLAAVCDLSKFNFVLAGDGELLNSLRARAKADSLSNVYLPGRVTDNLSMYFRAADVLILPGRGGIIISEAMAFSLPVVVFQGDGTEYDLVGDNETGLIVREGNVADFCRAIEFLQTNPAVADRMGKNGRKLVSERFTTENMVSQIKAAAEYVTKK